MVNKQNGRTSVQELAAITGQTELAVMEMVRFLEDNNLLEVQMGDYGRMHLKTMAHKVSGVKLPTPLKELLDESNAYRRHMNKRKI